MAWLQPKDTIRVLAQGGQLDNLANFKGLTALAVQHFPPLPSLRQWLGKLSSLHKSVAVQRKTLATAKKSCTFSFWFLHRFWAFLLETAFPKPWPTSNENGSGAQAKSSLFSTARRSRALFSSLTRRRREHCASSDHLDLLSESFGFPLSSPVWVGRFFIKPIGSDFHRPTSSVFGFPP